MIHTICIIKVFDAQFFVATPQVKVLHTQYLTEANVAVWTSTYTLGFAIWGRSHAICYLNGYDWTASMNVTSATGGPKGGGNSQQTDLEVRFIKILIWCYDCHIWFLRTICTVCPPLQYDRASLSHLNDDVVLLCYIINLLCCLDVEQNIIKGRPNTILFAPKK